MKKYIEELKSVLCDPEGKACIHGSEADLKVIDDAIDGLSKSMSITSMVEEAFSIAKTKGWHESPNPLPEVLMKIVCEAAEAMEEYRNKKPAVYIVDQNGIPVTIDVIDPNSFVKIEGNESVMIKPEGILIELADIVIRVADTCGENGLDLEGAIRTKMEYNRTRSYKHGGKRC
jgi:NTP pyrophosphatase (non-canonical NTP hydrolase)